VGRFKEKIPPPFPQTKSKRRSLLRNGNGNPLSSSAVLDIRIINPPGNEIEKTHGRYHFA